MKFSLRLKDLREKKGLSQVELAEALGIGVSTIGMWESTDRIPSAKKFNKLLEFFGCSPEYLLGESDTSALPIILSTDEREVLSLYQMLSPARKEDIKTYLRVLSGNSEISVIKKKA